MGHVVDVVMKLGELRCGGFSHIGNCQGEKPARKRQSSGALDRLNRFGRVLLAEHARRFIRPEI